MTDFITDQAAIDFYQEPVKEYDDYLYKAKQRADNWFSDKGVPYVVVEMGPGNYQIWAKSLVSKDYKVVYESGGQANEG